MVTFITKLGQNKSVGHAINYIYKNCIYTFPKNQHYML